MHIASESLKEVSAVVVNGDTKQEQKGKTLSSRAPHTSLRRCRLHPSEVSFGLLSFSGNMICLIALLRG